MTTAQAAAAVRDILSKSPLLPFGLTIESAVPVPVMPPENNKTRSVQLGLIVGGVKQPSRTMVRIELLVWVSGLEGK